QSCRVIWVREGMARRSASENSIGFSTSPLIFSFQSAKLLATIAAYSSLSGMVVPLARNFGAMSASLNSFAIDEGCRKKRCVFSVTSSALVRNSRKPEPCCERSLNDQPLRATAVAPAIPATEPTVRATPVRSWRRLSFLSMGGLRIDLILAGEHRSDVVPDARDEHEHDVDDHEEHDQRGADELDGARWLAAAVEVVQPRKRRGHARRHHQPGKNDQRQDAEDHDQVNQFLQDVVVALMRKLEPHVMHDRRPDVAQLLARGQQ